MNDNEPTRIRGWFSANGSLAWSSGISRELSDAELDAFYYYTPDDFIEWDSTPERWGDTYDIEADERAERRHEETSQRHEIETWGRYFEKMQEEWN